VFNQVNFFNKIMDVETLKQQVHANNIANVNTPGYKRHFVSFDNELQKAIDSQSLSLKTDNPKHISYGGDWRSVIPSEKIEYNTSSRNDGNNVDIDYEVAQMTKNTLKYQIVADLTSRLVSRYTTVLREVR
jgi:flagellar basal-body rod protein FlgB